MRAPAHPLRRAVALAALLGLVLAAGCGPVGSGGTGAAAEGFALGPVSGFGSVVVNGIHYDDAGASVVDAEGHPLSAQDDLHLGSSVDVQGGAGLQGILPASQIRVAPDLLGPVTSAYDPAHGVLEVMGQTVMIDPSTTFIDRIQDGALGLVPGNAVEVSALYDAHDHLYRATRVGLAAPGATYQLRARVDRIQGALLTLGPQEIETAGVALPPGLKVGQLVRLFLKPMALASGRWHAIRVLPGVALPPDGAEGTLRGAVSDVVDGRHATVDGVPVDAGTALLQPLHDQFVPGALVLVHGTMDGGTLVASRVDFRVPQVAGSGSGSRYGDTVFEIDGPILGPTAPASGTFVMRGPTTVDATHATLVGGTAADLLPGRIVHVSGRLGRGGTFIAAETITFAAATP